MANAATDYAEEVWQRRLEKRMDSIAVVKNSAVYRSYARVPRTTRSEGEPRTPSPGGRSTSTRQFRHRTKVWRHALPVWTVGLQTAPAQGCPDLAPAA